MDASEVTDVCRLCPATQNLLNVFDDRLSVKNNMREVILVTTGIEISESDIISKKICRKCYKNTQKIFEIRSRANRQDKSLKAKCQQYLGDKGIRLPNTCITIRKDVRHLCEPEEQNIVPNRHNVCKLSESAEIKEQPRKVLSVTIPTPTKNLNGIKGIHPSIIDVYRKNPQYKLPKKCLERHMAPIVSLAMGEVEQYFRRKKLNIMKFVYKPNTDAYNRQLSVSQKKSPSVTPMKIGKVGGHDLSCSSITPKKKNIHISYAPCSSNCQNNNDTNTDRIAIPKSPALNSSVSQNRKADSSRDKKLLQNFKPSIRKIRENVKKKARMSKKDKHQAKTQSETNSISCSSENFTDTRVKADSRDEILVDVDNLVSKETSNKGPNEESNSQHETIKKFTKKDIESNRTIIPEDLPTAEAHKKNINKSHKSSPSLESKRKAMASKDTYPFSKIRKPSIINNKTQVATSKSSEIGSEIDEISTATAETSSSTSDKCSSPSKSIESTQKTSHRHPSKPEFIQSLGLTPSDTLGQFKSILKCKICSSIHKNVTSLKKHSSRHRICPFCKLKFKTVERKQNHMDGNCEVKNITDSPGSFVSLEKIDLISDIRKRFKDVFSAFGIPGLEEPEDEVILLSDDEEDSQLIMNNSHVNVAENVVQRPESSFESVSIVKPIVSIHNNTILDGVKNNLSDKCIIKVLSTLLQMSEPMLMDQVVQTDLPCNQDIMVDRVDEICRLKTLKGHTLSYMVPVTLNNGDFNVSYSFDSQANNSASKMDTWTDVPLIEKRTINVSPEMPVMNATYPMAFLTSQVQPPQLSLSSIQLMTATPTMSFFLPNTSAFIPGSGLSIQPSINTRVSQTQTINNTFFSPIQTTPILQNYTLSMGALPVINNQVSSSTTNANIPNNVGVTSTVSSSVIAGPSDTTSVSAPRKSFPTLSKSKKMSISTRKSLSPSKKTTLKTKSKRIIKVKIGNLATRGSSSSKSKLRVRNIWELK